MSGNCTCAPNARAPTIHVFGHAHRVTRAAVFNERAAEPLNRWGYYRCEKTNASDLLTFLTNIYFLAAAGLTGRGFQQQARWPSITSGRNSGTLRQAISFFIFNLTAFYIYASTSDLAIKLRHPHLGQSRPPFKHSGSPAGNFAELVEFYFRCSSRPGSESKLLFGINGLRAGSAAGPARSARR